MTQIMRNPRIAMAGLLLLAFLVRAMGLGYCPPAMNSDELLKAFDGASVYLTGMDHHGDRWPLFFEQSGEYSPPLYIYFSGLFSAPFGINPYTLRLPSAILGTLSVLMAYLLASRWRGDAAGWTAAILVALSPWNIHYSRIGWEAISLIPLQLCGLWLFLRWTQEDRKRDLYLAAAAFALTTYAYPTARLYTPLIGVGLLIFFFQKLKAH
ncbi:glycosyltransferase family 39 protein, partial [bacterium]|nr:glycosyltransferase family 39 protein [bacterium]